MIRRLIDLILLLVGVVICVSLISEVIIPFHVMNVFLKVNKTQHRLLNLRGQLNMAKDDKRIIKDISELAFPSECIIDPFSSEPFIYDSSHKDEEYSYILISVGPDGIRNQNAKDEFIIYDPTNGIYSEGDMAVTESVLFFRDLGLRENFGILPTRR